MGRTAGAPFFIPSRIVSGGQTGVDRAALDAAIELGIPHGGWCPEGRRSEEDGTIPDKYDQLVETTGYSDYSVRTERNVIDSDATLILYTNSSGAEGELTDGGTRLTREICRRLGKPHLCVPLLLADEDRPQVADADAVRQWLSTHRPAVLNVAGPRESSAPGIYDRSRRFLQKVLMLGAGASAGPPSDESGRFDSSGAPPHQPTALP